MLHFKDIPGNSDLKDRIDFMLANNNFPHCSLFTGEEGSGVFPLVFAIISRLFCETSDEKACENCKQCKLLAKNNHPDIHYTFPIIYKKDKDNCNAYREQWNEFISESKFITFYDWIDKIQTGSKQGIIPVSEINDIVHFAQMHSYEEGPKILVIWKAELLGKNGNRLLKLIEEPPEDMYIFLLARSAEDLLNTIVSRSQRFHFNTPNKAATEQYLSKKFTSSDNKQIENASLLANGNIAKAIDILQNEQTSQVDMMVPWLRDCYSANAKKLYEWASSFKSMSREEQKQFWEYFLQFLREIQAINMGSKITPRLSDTELKSANKMSKILNLKSISEIQDIANQSSYAIQRNSRPDLTFLAASFRVHQAFHNNS